MNSTIRVIVVSMLAVAGTGCISNLTGDSYSRDEARASQRVEFGTIEHLRDVKIEGTKTVIGPAVGGAVGAIAAEDIGDGNGSDVAQVLGGVAGGALGAAVEEGITRRDGVEITVKFDDGHRIAVVQEIDPNAAFRVGDEVRVLYLDGRTRIAY